MSNLDPAYSGGKSSPSGGGIESLTGEGVNNADPLNPVIEQTPTPTAIHRTQSNALTTTVTGIANFFVNAAVDNLDPVAPPYAGDFEQGVIDEFALSYAGTNQSYKIDISGSIIALSPAFLGTYIGAKVTGDLQGDFTGGVKFYPIGVSFGSSPAIGFQITVYGQFAPNELLRLQLSSSTAGDLRVIDCIFVAEKIQPIA